MLAREFRLLDYWWLCRGCDIASVDHAVQVVVVLVVAAITRGRMAAAVVGFL